MDDVSAGSTSTPGIGHNQPLPEQPRFYSDGAKLLTTRVKAASAYLAGVGLQPAYVDMSLESVITAGEFMPRRRFHITNHFNSVGDARDSEELKWAFEQYGVGKQVAAKTRAIMTRAAAHHDVVYFHNDRAFAPGVQSLIDPYIGMDVAVDAEAKSLNKPQLLIKADAPENPVFDTALQLFGLQRGKKLDPYINQNEFLSAVYAGLRGVQSGIPFQYVVAEMAMIEATVPWGPPDRFTRAKAQLIEINNQLKSEKDRALKGQIRPDPLTGEEINACMAGAVAIANTDVKGIADLREFCKGTVSILQETGINFSDLNSMRQGIGNHIQFFLEPKKAQFKSGAAAVFHHYPGLPERDDFIENESSSHRSFRESQKMLEALVVASMLGEKRAEIRLPVAPRDVGDAFEAFNDAFTTRPEDAPDKINMKKLTPIAAQIYTLYRDKPDQLSALAQSVYSEPGFKLEIQDHVVHILKEATKSARQRA